MNSTGGETVDGWTIAFNSVKLIADFIQNAAWPILVACVLIYLLRSNRAPARLQEFVSLFDSFKLFGTEFVFSKDTRERAEAVFERYRAQVGNRCDEHVRAQGIDYKLQKVAESIMSDNYDLRQAGDLRWTIHIPDVLFDDTLYQLLDYYPPQPKPGKGRRWSIRFGMIGLAWRTTTTQVQGEVLTSEAELVSRWGMTREEAKKAGRGRQSFMCIVLESSQKTHVGMLYIDSAVRKVFGTTTKEEQELIAKIKAECDKHKLADSVSELLSSLRPSGPLIRIHTSFI